MTKLEPTNKTYNAKRQYPTMKRAELWKQGIDRASSKKNFSKLMRWAGPTQGYSTLSQRHGGEKEKPRPKQP